MPDRGGVEPVADVLAVAQRAVGQAGRLGGQSPALLPAAAVEVGGSPASARLTSRCRSTAWPVGGHGPQLAIDAVPSGTYAGSAAGGELRQHRVAHRAGRVVEYMDPVGAGRGERGRQVWRAVVECCVVADTRRGRVATLAGPPVMPTVRQPSSFATGRRPRRPSPAAVETTTVSPGFGSPRRVRPSSAVTPFSPSTPSCAESGRSRSRTRRMTRCRRNPRRPASRTCRRARRRRRRADGGSRSPRRRRSCA